MKPIIEVKNISKEYRRGAQKEQYLSLRDQVFKSFNPSRKKETFMALEDISFEVYPGDSLAIIGKNGAGKSTLLKILSRITPPTKGEIILRGRLASLLEVGTGFHPELTGRENVFLNGSILGLGRAEINRQFDAIVDFSGVGPFLDTPLKHYSSGMQLRLAFAVAAHLEPEILVIDEVLAVGDSAFQQKCIEKMTEVSKSGRTILFVSHNMQAVRNLCETGILLENGIMSQKGKIDDIISSYHNDLIKSESVTRLDNIESRKGKGHLIFQKILIPNQINKPGEKIKLGLQLKTIVPGLYQNLDFGVAIKDFLNNTLIHVSNKYISYEIDHQNDSDIYWFEIENDLKSGNYSLTLFIRASDEIEDWISDKIFIEIGEGNSYGYSNTDEIQGMIQPGFNFYLNYHGK
ncbi:ATP-binding cassette domain-containing protein [Cryomorpha ignava]|uniref:ATP-binding cassette domain-containing protein n=1 Tax=Cryomorpha ignava TaxID=101383 RepID=A0A7K3WP34_9FLAO|nr:ABC transporter ATP-binding protein [Cryomorpha ignava]NEN23423.1 ATP-binding cassette domain-containing protein [Cryomorpha ignava]